MSTVQFSRDVPKDYLCGICQNPESKERFIEHTQGKGNLHPLHQSCLKLWAKRIRGDNVPCTFCQEPMSKRSIKDLGKSPNIAYYRNLRNSEVLLIADNAFCSLCSEDFDKGSLRDIAGHKVPSGLLASSLYHTDCLKDAFHDKFMRRGGRVRLSCGDCLKEIDHSKTLYEDEGIYDPAFREDAPNTLKVSLLISMLRDGSQAKYRTGEIKASRIDTVGQVKEALRKKYSILNKREFNLILGISHMDENKELDEFQTLSENSVIYIQMA